MNKIKVSVIILSWNTKQLLKQCLNSLISKPKLNNIELEVIVVDNGSIDQSQDMIEREFPWAILIKNKNNLGFAKGNNQGIKIATGEFIMLLNSDTVVEEETLEILALQLIKYPQIGAVSPLLLLPNKKLQLNYYMRFPNLWQVFLYHHPVLRPLIMKTPFKWLIVSKTKKNIPFTVDQLPGAALMARKEVWEKVGLLDENYHFLFEDVDWCFQAKNKGIKLMVIPKSKVIHYGGASWKKRLKKDSFTFYHQYFSSMLIFIKKNYGQFKFYLFRLALIVNFLSTFKFRLAKEFLRGEINQDKLWL